LNDAAQCTVMSCCAGTAPFQSHFQDLVIANPRCGLYFCPDARVLRSFPTRRSSDLTAGSLTVSGNVTTSASSTMTITGLTVGGSLTASGTYSVATSTFTVTISVAQTSWPGNLVLAGTNTISATSPVTVNGNLTVTGT